MSEEQKAIEAIQKQFGKESIMKMGSSGLVVESIPTGSYLLDKALGVGGIPRGRTIEIFGPESSGKCLPKDTDILTSSGYKTIAEIFEEVGFDACCSDKTEEVKYPLQNRHGEEELTTHFTWNNRKPLIKISTQSGNFIKSTYNHPHLTISKIGNLVWKKTGEMNVGDYLVSPRKCGVFGKTEVITEEAYLLGCFVADASFTEKEGVQFTNDDQDIKDLVESKYNQVFSFRKFNKYPNNKNSSSCYHFDKIGSRAFFEKYRIKPGKAKDKLVPLVVRSGDQNTVRSFLQGYMDCEAYFCSYLEVTSASEKLLRQVRLLLLQFGIVSKITKGIAKAYPDIDYWTLYLYGEDYENYLEHIGTKSKSREKQIKDSYKVPTRTNTDSIPFMGLLLKDLYNSFEPFKNKSGVFFDYMGEDSNARLTYYRLKIILDCSPKNKITEYLQYLYNERFFFDPVVSIEPVAPEPTFDFAMEKTHSFVANGIITHNTTLALHILAQAQKFGATAFIDAEHALDIKYAKAIGVDIKEMYISQPECGEDSLEIVDMLVRSNDFSLIVIDSVAALVPRAEIEGDMGQAHMGLQARLMSQSLRKLTGVAAKSNCSIIFINQLRANIGVTYGSHETTTGGNALKFYASVRLDIRRIEKIKDKTEAFIGNKVKIKVVKNKVAPPFREAETYIMFGVGIDRNMELLDYLVGLNIIERAGAWFKYKDQRFQGKDNVIKLIESNREEFEKIIKEENK